MFFNRNKDKSKRILLGVMVFVLTYGLLVTSIAPRKYNLEEGDIATVDIKAPRDTVDEVSTKEREKEIIEKIGKQYTLNGDVKIKAEENIKKLFDKISNINSTDMDEKEKILSIKKVEEFNLNDSEYKTLISVSKEQLTLAHWFVLDTLNLAYGEPIEENNLEHIQKAKSIVDNEFRKQSFDRNLEDVLKDIIYSQIKPNFFFDKEKTDEKIREAQKNVPKEIIKKNQTIVKEGEPITARQIELLKELGLLDRGGGKNYLYTYIVLAIFVIVVLLLEYSYISKERKDLFEDTKMMTMISMINLIILVLSRGLSIISPFLIPLAFAPILLTVLLDYKVSLVINFLNILLISVVVGFRPAVIILAITSVIIGSTTLKKIQQRNDVLYSTLYMSVI